MHDGVKFRLHDSASKGKPHYEFSDYINRKNVVALPLPWRFGQCAIACKNIYMSWFKISNLEIIWSSGREATSTYVGMNEGHFTLDHSYMMVITCMFQRNQLSLSVSETCCRCHLDHEVLFCIEHGIM